MPKRTIVLISAGFLLLIGVVLFTTRKEAEPSYKGKTLSKWLVDCYNVRSTGVPHLREAQEAVRAIGTNGIPLFLRYAYQHDQYNHTNAVLVWAARLGFTPAQDAIERRASEPFERQMRGQIGITLLGADAEPFLIQLLANTNNDVTTRQRAALAMFLVGTNATRCDGVLRDAVLNGDRMVASVAAVSLGAVARDKELAVETLASALTNRDWFVRLDAVIGLGFLSNCPAAVNLVRTRLSDTNSHVRNVASNTLARLNAADDPHSPGR